VAINVSVRDSKLEQEPEQAGYATTLRATRRRDRRRSPISSGWLQIFSRGDAG